VTVREVWAVHYDFLAGEEQGTRREYQDGKLVEERPATLNEALPRELHPIVRGILDEG